MDGEDYWAFEAALAFIDECDKEITELSDCSDESVHDVSAFNTTRPTPLKRGSRRIVKNSSRNRQVCEDAQDIARIKTKLAIPGRNRSRDLQKLELLELRVEAAALEERVRELRRDKGLNPNSSIENRCGLVRRADAKLLEACENLAKRQKKLRREAESENENLRDLVQGQMRTISKLKKLFLRQYAAKIPRSAWIFNVRMHEAADKSCSVLQQLISSLGDVFDDTDHVMRSNGLCGIRTPFSQRTTQPLSASTAYLEVLKCEFLPFDYRKLGQALMGGMASSLTSCEEMQIQSRFKDTAVARATTLEVNEHAKIRYRLTGNIFHENKREVIVVSGHHELLEVFGEAVDGIYCKERTWCVLTEESPGLCLLQLCMAVTLESQLSSKGSQQFLNRVSEMLSHLYQEMFDSVAREVETALLVE